MPALPRTRPSNVVPGNRAEAIAWYRRHTPGWQQRGAALGLTPERTRRLTDAVDDAAEADADYERLVIETAAAATRAGATASEMNRQGNATIKAIRAEADSSLAPGRVYAAAEIPPPAARSPLGPPATPTAVTLRLTHGGVVEVTWSASLRNTSFNVERSLRMADGTSTPYRLLGASVSRPLLDTTLPPGTETAFYRVRAVRGGRTIRSSDWSPPGVLQLVNNTNTAHGEPPPLAA